MSSQAAGPVQRGRTSPSAALERAQVRPDTVFWRRHAMLGTVLSSAVVVQIALYAWLAVGVRQRHALFVLIIVSAIFTAASGLIAPAVIRHGRHPWFFYSWSGCVVVVLLIACAVSGGALSPVTASLFLPLLYAALAYPPIAVLVLGAAATIGYATVSAIDGSSSPAYACVVASTLLAATIMATRSARNRRDQQAQLRGLADQLWDQATRDELTRCLNRRGFDVALDVEMTRATRYGRPFALMLVDVDCLKNINDARGHEAGDAALRTVADALVAGSRRSDVIARLGGDEFVVIAVESTVDDAVALAGRVHDEVHRMRSDDTLTVSIGIAAGEVGCEPAKLLRRADSALYEAKHAGRNCTRVCPPRAQAPAAAR